MVKWACFRGKSVLRNVPALITPHKLLGPRVSPAFVRLTTSGQVLAHAGRHSPVHYLADAGFHHQVLIMLVSI